MKIEIVKQHEAYPLGEVEVSDERAQYLLNVGVAVDVKEKKEVKEKAEKKESNPIVSKKTIKKP